MTNLEKRRFNAFKFLHPDAKIKTIYPPECGYYIHVYSKRDNIEEDITDIEYMETHV